MLLLIVSISVALFSTAQGTNLALTFDANNSTCTAACATCDNKETQDNTDISSQDIQQLINITFNNTQSINHVLQKLDNIVISLSHIKNATTSNAGAINDVLLLVEDILQIQNGSSFSSLPTSCQEIKSKQPNSPTGVYLLATSSGKTNYVYCHMGELCGTEGGWTRLAYLDMSDSTENCPTGFKLYESNGVRACGRATSSAGSCQSVQFPSNGIRYSQVCGRVVGYQYASTDGVYPGDYTGETYGSVITSEHNNINSYYTDGVSITRGSPRKHIWTLMAGLIDASLDQVANCPCSQGSVQNTTLQSFIGNDYFCESGNPSTDSTWQAILYTQDPLWDGKGCSSLEENCCSAPGLPWFNKLLNSTTTDYIELRVCCDQDTAEDVPVSFYEIYVKQ